tara:strand:- start:3263 stop:3574 length:312 start_codon:yes stop_codon:yes gene_type:complete
MANKKKFTYIKPSWWEILIYIVYMSTFLYFRGGYLFSISLTSWLLYFIGFICLFVSIQGWRFHYQKGWAWKDSHKVCRKAFIAMFIISIVILIAVIIDVLRFS